MKRLTVNQRANKEMKQYCIDNDIRYCEKCHGNHCQNYCLTFAHKHKRRWYYDKPVEWLWKRSEWKLLGLKCHEEIEYNSQLTQELFSDKMD